MAMRSLSALFATVLFASLLGGCDSSNGRSDAALPDAHRDVTFGHPDAAPNPVDAPSVEDTPSWDTALLPVDAPESSDRPVLPSDSNPDLTLVTLPDARVPDARFPRLVEYCPDIQPLSALQGGTLGRSSCPTTFAEATLLAQSDAGQPYYWPELRVGRCSDGPWVLVHGNLGGLVCFFRSDSQQLFAAEYTSDVPFACRDKSLESYVPEVFNEYVPCGGVSWISLKTDGG
jgi:hypothetical protein